MDARRRHVLCFVRPGAGPVHRRENGAPLGNAAFLGTSVGEGTLSQSLSTVAGQSYDLTFLLQSDTGTAAPDFFTTYVNGIAISPLSVLNVGQVDWTQYSAVFTASGASTTLEFAFRNDPSYFELTDVSIPEPATLLVVGGGLGMNDARSATETVWARSSREDFQSKDSVRP